MTDHERALTQRLCELTLLIWKSQGDEINALRRANDALQKSHDIIGDMLKVVGELVKPS